MAELSNAGGFWSRCPITTRALDSWQGAAVLGGSDATDRILKDSAGKPSKRY